VIRFVWTRLIHSPCPSKLVYIDSYSPDYLVGSSSDFVTLTSFDLDLVRILVSVSFDTQYFSSGFSYECRSIATPFLSTVGLEDPAKDRRLLGNCVYSPIFTRFSPWSFKEFFTGTDSLGYYDFNSVLFGADKERRLLSNKAIVNYYVVDTSGKERISKFFSKYQEAEIFARKVFMEPDEAVKNFFMVSVMISSIRSCIRRLKHPIGIFAYVQTMAGSINASELLFEFRSRLIHGGGS